MALKAGLKAGGYTSKLMLHRMHFTVEFYETETGKCPVREFLDELKGSDPDDFAVVVAGLSKLRNRQYHREPLSQAIGDGFFELRHVGKLNTRLFGSS
jgi:hypothetical protein